MTKNIYAFTAAGVNYPPYISVNKAPFGNSEEIAITVRSQALEFGFCGPQAEITLTKEQARQLAQALLAETQ